MRLRGQTKRKQLGIPKSGQVLLARKEQLWEGNQASGWALSKTIAMEVNHLVPMAV